MTVKNELKGVANSTVFSSDLLFEPKLRLEHGFETTWPPLFVGSGHEGASRL